MRILVTGAKGFVGPHLISELDRRFGADAEIFPTARCSGLLPTGQKVVALDIADDDQIAHVISDVRPTHVLHLGAISSPSLAGADPKLTWNTNTLGTLALSYAILRKVPECWLVFAGSGLVYGDTARSGEPLDESALLAPNGEYAVTKAAADLAIGALAGRGLKSMRLRFFNHTGPGQTEEFVVPAFAAQIARIEAGLRPPVLQVGNLEVARDFLDVRDVAAAYALAISNCHRLGSGLVFNIASGKARSVRSVLDGLLALSRVPIAVELDQTRLRPNDIPVYYGCAEKARRVLGWESRYDFADTLAAVLAYWREQVASNSPV